MSNDPYYVQTQHWFEGATANLTVATKGGGLHETMEFSKETAQQLASMLSEQEGMDWYATPVRWAGERETE